MLGSPLIQHIGFIAGLMGEGRILMDSDDVLYIVMPAYNEEDNIETVIREWYPVIEKHSSNGKSRLIIVNDGSKDNTYAIAAKLQTEMPQLVVLDKPNSGHGATLLYAYHYALQGGTYIFQTDSDGQTRPEEFEKILAAESGRQSPNWLS